jgi:hypothetical protein
MPPRYRACGGGAPGDLDVLGGVVAAPLAAAAFLAWYSSSLTPPRGWGGGHIPAPFDVGTLGNAEGLTSAALPVVASPCSPFAWAVLLSAHACRRPRGDELAKAAADIRPNIRLASAQVHQFEGPAGQGCTFIAVSFLSYKSSILLVEAAGNGLEGIRHALNSLSSPKAPKQYPHTARPGGMLATLIIAIREGAVQVARTPVLGPPDRILRLLWSSKGVIANARSPISTSNGIHS